MNPYRILSVDDPVDAVKLARKAKRVTNVHSTEVILGIQRLKRAATAWEHETGHRCEGLAAPQIGWNRRVIIVRVTNEMEPKDPRKFTNDEIRAVLGEEAFSFPEPSSVKLKWLELLDSYDKWKYASNGFFDPWMVLINPTVKQVEGERKSTEGCLSVPHGGYEVTRPTHVAFKYTLPNKTFSGMQLAKDSSAVVLMHEIDHLRGKCIKDSGTLIIGGGEEKL